MVITPLVPNPASALSGGGSPDILDALRSGQTVLATVLARLETGAARLSLLGTLLDIVPVEPVEPGDTLRLTVVDNKSTLAVAVERLAPRDASLAATLRPEPVRTAVPQTDAPGQDPRLRPRRAEWVTLTPSAVGLMRPDEGDIAPLDLSAEAGARLGAAAPPASSTAKAALAAMISDAATRQDGRGPLIANALAVLAGPAGDRLPKTVRETLAALVATAVEPATLDGPALRDGVARSGTFHEANMLRFAATTVRAEDEAGPRADAKGVLLALRSALQGVVGQDPAANRIGPADPPPLPQRGAPPAAQRTALPSLPDSFEPLDIASTLLDGAEGALDRIRLLQSASLPDERRPAQGEARADRLVEFPIALPGGRYPVLSMAIGREARGPDPAAAAPAWRMRLSLDLEETGPLHALVSLRGKRAGVTLWAERPETADLFRASIGELRDALTTVDLDIEGLDVRTGAPASARPAPAGTFLDLRS